MRFPLVECICTIIIFLLLSPSLLSTRLSIRSLMTDTSLGYTLMANAIKHVDFYFYFLIAEGFKMTNKIKYAPYSSFFFFRCIISIPTCFSRPPVALDRPPRPCFNFMGTNRKLSFANLVNFVVSTPYMYDSRIAGIRLPVPTLIRVQSSAASIIGGEQHQASTHRQASSIRTSSTTLRACVNPGNTTLILKREATPKKKS